MSFIFTVMSSCDNCNDMFVFVFVCVPVGFFPYVCASLAQTINIRPFRVDNSALFGLCTNSFLSGSQRSATMTMRNAHFQFLPFSICHLKICTTHKGFHYWHELMLMLCSCLSNVRQSSLFFVIHFD